jgi:SulP family sulfate permease
LPPLSAPDFSLDTIRHLAPSALAVTLFALTEAVSIGRSLAARTGDRVDGNQEFIGQGLSNIAGSFFSGYVATGSFNRSALNFQSGARTPLAAAFAGLLLMVIVLLVAPLAAYLPNAAMAGILFLVAWGLLDFKEIRHILTSSRRETAILAVTFLSALFLELEVAIFAGILLSLVLYLERVSHPRVISPVPDPAADKRALSDRPHLMRCPQLRLLRIDGSLFFGSVNYIEDVFDRLHDAFPDQKHLAIIAEGINFADIAGGSILVKEAQRRKKEGGALYLIHVKKGLWEALDKDGSLDAIGPEHVFASKKAAIRGIYHQLDKERCRQCESRIFEECREEFGPPEQDDAKK